ncbi:MarR family winged helix-turn-helix transcriptional regulator [Methylobacterium frigidaeris]|uniref:Transcriptional activatory protein BadR n=1 Tax=Methylobacterium frigidaeris TaxID=2038277 RepID=A0AA37HBH5_9HYPH|nr:MarR family transcriptional regulator [Methylobacterium frigidaeris]PIK74136.1 MarR family transcriptional regulator [Methylobacterium frigidaeris]GJD62623.1 Transcriptional activatory protein BadR [Methylobacterium frigidaeris]
MSRVEAATALILEVFRLNGALLAAGDALTRDLGLTSARWQVLGAVALAGRPLTVAGAARAMGLTRQAVRRLVTELAADGFVALAPNPDHRRAALVVLTEDGQRAYAAAQERQAAWAARVTEGCEPASLRDSTTLLRCLRAALERDEESGAPETGS